MKLSILSCSALLLFSVSANAKEESRFQIVLNGGYSLPQKPDIFKDVYNNGFNLGGGVGYCFFGRLTVQGLVNYDRFSVNESGISDLLDPDLSGLGLELSSQGGQFSVLSLSGELKVSFVGDSSKVSPYALGGGGIANVSAGDLTISATVDPELVSPYDFAYGINPYFDPRFLELETTIEGESETKAMVTVGGGVDIPLGGRIRIFVEGRYQFSFTSDERTDFVSFRGGVRIGL